MDIEMPHWAELSISYAYQADRFKSEIKKLTKSEHITPATTIPLFENVDQLRIELENKLESRLEGNKDGYISILKYLCAEQIESAVKDYVNAYFALIYTGNKQLNELVKSTDKKYREYCEKNKSKLIHVEDMIDRAVLSRNILNRQSADDFDFCKIIDASLLLRGKGFDLCNNIEALRKEIIALYDQLEFKSENLKKDFLNIQETIFRNETEIGSNRSLEIAVKGIYVTAGFSILAVITSLFDIFWNR